jgi:hypothetical protein
MQQHAASSLTSHCNFRLRPDSPRSLDQDKAYFPPLTYASPPSSPAFQARSALDFGIHAPQHDAPATPSLRPGLPGTPGGGDIVDADVEQAAGAGPITTSPPYVIADVRQPVSTRMGPVIYTPPVAPYNAATRGLTPLGPGPLPLAAALCGPVSWWVPPL